MEHIIINRRHHIVDHGHGIQFRTGRRKRIVLGSEKLILPGPCVLRNQKSLMCHIMSRLAHIPQILEKLGRSTLLARSGMTRTRGPGRTVRSCGGATKIGMLHLTITEPKGETGMLTVLTRMCKLASHPGVNELLNKRTISLSHARNNRPLRLVIDEVTNIKLPRTPRLAPI
jgi:hypothetical protein